MKVGFYQFVPEFGNVEKNIQTMVNAVKAADADLIVFPELATSGYLFLEQKEVADTASAVPGPMSDAFSKVAVEKNTAVVVGFPEKADGVYYNSALIATPDGKVQVYRKNHLYNEETRSFSCTFSMSPTLPSALSTAFSSMAMRRIFAALNGFSSAFLFAMKRVV